MNQNNYEENKIDIDQVEVLDNDNQYQDDRARAKAHEIEHGSDDEYDKPPVNTNKKMMNDPQNSQNLSRSQEGINDLKLQQIKVGLEGNIQGSGQNDYINSDKQHGAPSNMELDSHMKAQFEKKSNCQKCLTFIKWIGAILSLLSVGVDILYAYKSPYANSLIFQLTCGVLAIRLLVTFCIGQYYYTRYVRNWKPSMAGMSESKGVQEDQEDSQDEVEDQGKSESIRFSEMRKQGQGLYASLHILLYTGFYRILPVKDFVYVISFGYASEWILSFIPMFFLEMLNNAETLGDLNLIQSMAVQIKVILFLFLVTEIIILISEARHVRAMRKLKMPSFDKMTEIQRRRKYNKTMSMLSIVSVVILIVLIVAFSIVGEGRQCAERQVLQNAVCVDCNQESCLECASNSPEGCNKCDAGFILNSKNRCEDCDDLEFKKCVQCKFASDGKTKICEKCSEGFRLEGGKCIACSQSQYCAECSEDKCLKCKEGSRFSNGNCIPCSSSLSHCVQCESQDKCSKCDYHIANLDDSGQCSKCRTENNWIKNDVTNKCQCNDFVNVLQGNKCQTCKEVLPGCQQCEQTDNPGKALSKKIGYSSELSPRKGEYVMCKKCGNNMIFDKVTNQCQYCDKKHPLCYSCSDDGNTCNRCKSGSMKLKTRSGTKCIACSYWGPACRSCTSQGCNVCKKGFNSVLGFCFRAWF